MSLKVLGDQFYDQPRYCFGSSLLDHSSTPIDAQKTIEYPESNELNLYDATFDEYFSISLDEHELVIHSKLVNSNTDIYVPDESYYVVEMFNTKGECLNEMIKRAKDEQVGGFYFGKLFENSPFYYF